MNFYSVIPARRERKSEFLNPWDNSLIALNRQMNRLFGDFLGEGNTSLEKVMGDFVPRLNFTENEKEFTVEAELPGVDEKDVEVSLSDGYLTIRGHKKHESERKDGEKQVYFERSYGSFERTLPLACEVDEDKVDASFKKGVLTVKLPKSQKAAQQAKKVTIRSS